MRVWIRSVPPGSFRAMNGGGYCRLAGGRSAAGAAASTKSGRDRVPLVARVAEALDARRVSNAAEGPPRRDQSTMNSLAPPSVRDLWGSAPSATS
jgi:hypothetical protein